MNESKEVDINKLIVRIETKLEEFKLINDNSHSLIRFYFDQLIEEINEQSFEAYRMLSEHFNSMISTVANIKNNLLKNVPNESINTRMTFWTMNAEELLESNNCSAKQCIDLFKQEQDISAILTRKFYEYMDFKKIVIAPIKEHLDMGSVFGRLIEKDFFYLQVPRNKFKFLTVSIDGTFRKWLSNKYECVETFKSNEEVKFSRLINQNVLITIGESVKLWDIKSFKLIKSLPKFRTHIDCFKLSENRIFISLEDGILECWNLEDQTRIFSTLAHDKLITSIKIISNKYVLTSSKDSRIILWNYETGEKVRTYLGHRSKVFRLKIISDTKFASCSEDKTSCLWDIESEKYSRMLVGHQSKILNLKYGNNTLVTGSFDCTIRYWDVNTGRNTKVLKGHAHGINYLKLYLEDNLLVSISTDHVIFIWDFVNAQCIQKLVDHQDFIFDTKLIDKTILLSASHDGTAKIWNIDRNNCLASYENCLSPIMNVHRLD